jgi:hypothetical protein
MESITTGMNKLDLNKDTNYNYNLSLDISNTNVDEIYKNDKTNKWIKLINNNQTANYDEYHRKSSFKLVANIKLDTEIHAKGKNKGRKARNTLIMFEPTIDSVEFNNDETEWIYILTINNRIVKIGGTRTGLKGRVGSYLCGHHIKERGKSGDCSNTNAYIYNTFVFYSKLNCDIKMYGLKLPKTEVEIDILDKRVKVIAQTYHAYETIYMTDYQEKYNMVPVLCDNCDPKYK